MPSTAVGLNSPVNPVSAEVMLDGRVVQVALLPDPWHSTMAEPVTKNDPDSVTMADFGGAWAKVTVWDFPVDAWVVA